MGANQRPQPSRFSRSCFKVLLAVLALFDQSCYERRNSLVSGVPRECLGLLLYIVIRAVGVNVFVAVLPFCSFFY